MSNEENQATEEEPLWNQLLAADDELGPGDDHLVSQRPLGVDRAGRGLLRTFV